MVRKIELKKMCDLFDDKETIYYNCYYLSPRERGVVELILGYEDKKERGYEEVGQLYGITSQRVQAVFRKASRKIVRNYVSITSDILNNHKDLIQEFTNGKSDD